MTRRTMLLPCAGTLTKKRPLAGSRAESARRTQTLRLRPPRARQVLTSRRTRQRTLDGFTLPDTVSTPDAEIVAFVEMRGARACAGATVETNNGSSTRITHANHSRGLAIAAIAVRRLILRPRVARTSMRGRPTRAD